MLFRSRIPDYGGWQRVTPVLAGTFLVAGLSSLALPGLSSFVSEFLVLQGTFMRYKVPAVIAAVGIVLAALEHEPGHEAEQPEAEQQVRTAEDHVEPAHRGAIVGSRSRRCQALNVGTRSHA